MNLSYVAHLTTPNHKNRVPWVMIFINLVEPFLIVSLSALCQGVEKKIYKDLMHLYYMANMASPITRTPAVRGHEIDNFGRAFIGHHNYRLSLSALCPGKVLTKFKAPGDWGTLNLQFMPH